MELELQQTILNHQNGNLEEAEKGYLELIKENPEDGKLNFLLGTLYLQGGKPDVSSVFLGKSVSKNPADVKAINNLGLAYQSMGKYEEAIKLFLSALKVDKKYLSAYNNLGICYQLTGDYKNAVEALKTSLQLNENDDETNYNLGAVLHNQGQISDALKYYLKAVELNPNYVEALYNIALIKINENNFENAEIYLEKAHTILPENFDILFNLAFVNEKLGNTQKAKELYKSALKLNPFSSELNFNLGNIFKDEKDWAEAEKYYLNALKQKEDVKIYNNLGFVQHRRGNYESAEKNYLSALKLDEDYLDAKINYGAALLEMGKIEEAVKQYDEVLQKDENNSSAKFNKAVALLLSGNLKEAWDFYEARFEITPALKGNSKIEKPKFVKPEWNGEDLNGKTILIYDEQGAGDSIQFVRFLKLLKEQNAKTIFKCRKELLNLFKNFEGIDELVELTNSVVSNYDYEISLMSIPKVLNIDLNNIPAPDNYLTAQKELSENCKTKLETNKYKVGLVWQGNPNHEYDYKRSVSLDYFEELLKNSNAVFYSLQLKNDEDLQSRGIIDLSNEIDSFETSAAIISKLDLVITVDTAVAHLAGALGKETWILLPVVPDWRWLMSGSDSPWYPSVKLFRQKEIGNWQNVFEEVNDDFKKLFAAEDELEKDFINKKIEAFQLHVNGEIDKAEKIYVELLDFFGDDSELCFWLASLYKSKKEFEKAVKYFEQALLINPNYFEAAEALAPIYEEKENYKKAAELYEKLLSRDENNFNLLFKLGELHGRLFNLDLAEKYLNKALVLDDNNFDLLNIFGLVLQKNNKLDEAQKMFFKAEEVSPLTAGIYLNIGTTYLLQKKFDDALRNFNEAIKLDNGFKNAHISKGITLLLNEQYEAGWKEFVWGLNKPNGITKENLVPIWKPLSGNGETVLVYAEQGAGDIIQFARYLSLIKELDYKVIFECPASLKELFEKCIFVDEVIVSGQTNYNSLKYDFYVPLLGLPGIFNTNTSNIPVCDEVFKLNTNTTNEIEFDKNKFNIGFVWAGNPKNGNDHLRSTKLKNFEKLFESTDAEFFSLQKESGRDIDVVCAKYKNVHNLSNKLTSFLKTAEIINKLDLVISVETGVAHLAGTLGKETWTLLPYVPDWRWLLEREDSPWYSSMKLFRQNKPGGWQSVFENVENELKNWIVEKSNEQLLSNNYEEKLAKQKQLVRALLNENKVEEAKQLLHEILKIKKSSDAYFELGYCYHLQNNFPSALENYNKTLELNPKDYNALNNIGILLKDLKRFDDAANSLLLSLKINHNNPVALNNLGIIMDLKGDFQTAIELFRNAINLDANYAEAYLNISNCYDSLGQTDEALESINKALAINPGYVDAHFNKSLILLKDAKFEDGLKEYEWRLKKKEYPVRNFGRPELNTKVLSGKKVLVFDEQGYGDTLNFARYLNELKKLGAEVYLECHSALAGLMNNCIGVDQVFERGVQDLKNVEHDYQISLLSLPNFFETNIENIPSDVPYLDVDNKTYQYWRGWLSEYNKPKIGLVWEGKKPLYNTHRATTLEYFSVLTELRDFQFISLQIGDVAEKNKKLMNDYNIVDPSQEIKSFSDTAAIIKNLDLVISIDTSVAHLAGALGANVWTLLSYKADWRWFKNTDESPWYPTMKLFRQKKFNDWQELLLRIKIQLQKELTQILD